MLYRFTPLLLVVLSCLGNISVTTLPLKTEEDIGWMTIIDDLPSNLLSTVLETNKTKTWADATRDLAQMSVRSYLKRRRAKLSIDRRAELVAIAATSWQKYVDGIALGSEKGLGLTDVWWQRAKYAASVYVQMTSLKQPNKLHNVQS